MVATGTEVKGTTLSNQNLMMKPVHREEAAYIYLRIKRNLKTTQELKNHASWGMTVVDIILAILILRSHAHLFKKLQLLKKKSLILV